MYKCMKGKVASCKQFFERFLFACLDLKPPTLKPAPFQKKKIRPSNSTSLYFGGFQDVMRLIGWMCNPATKKTMGKNGVDLA